MQLITLSGVDGSGKSHQAKRLKEHFEQQGKKVYCFHAVQFSIASKLANGVQIGHKRRADTRSVTYATWLGIQLRKIALFIDIFRFKRLFKKLDRSRYDCILSDRYFYDSVINILYLSLERRAEKSNIGEIYVERFIPAPDTAIYISVDPHVVISRKVDPEQGIEYLKIKNNLFDKKTGQWNLKTVDGNKSKQDVFEKIKNLCQLL